MKNTLLILSIITLIFAGCKKDDIAEASKVRIETETIEKGWDYIKINVEYDYPVALEAVTLYLSEKEDMSDANVYECNVEGKKYSVDVDSLKAGVAYYYCYEYDNGYEKEKGGKKSMQTVSKPVVVTKDITSITTTSATLNGSLTNSDAANKITEKGFCWGMEKEPTIEGNHISKGSGTGTYSHSLTNLTNNTTYHVRAYVKTNFGIVYGEEKSFTTVEIVLPTVTTNTVTNITTNSATCGGNVTFDGNATVTARGICWSTSPNPTIEKDNKINNGSGTGSFTSYMSGLKDGTTYYVRAYATNEKGTSYGEEKTFTTVEIVLPTVTTNTVTNIKATTATCGGYVSSDGNATVTARGICWSTNQNPTIEDNKTTDGGGIGSYSSYLSYLSDNTTYYIRAYATNEKGTSYGEEKSFATLKKVLPTVTTNAVTNIKATTATCGGYVSSDGNATVTARGICWSTTPNPTINDNKINNGSGTGSFTSYMSGLQDGTTYYVRAYATNEVGTVYGEEKSFTTVEIVLPTVTTNTVTNIKATTATCGGNVTSDGNRIITARGICWSTSPNPTIEKDNKINNGSGTGSFTSYMSGLKDGTTYYVRAYATNEKGTSYGDEESFTTVEIVLPTVATNSVTNITSNSVTCGGNVISDGNASVTSRGVCWSTSPNPTIADNKTTDGSGIGSFTSSLSNIASQTTYYVRAYATNEKGTAYGEEKNFTTSGTENGHDYVDLGLPSGLKWATCNVGANTPEAYGDYFAWGETSTKETYTADKCPTYGLSISQLQSRGYIDGEGKLTPQYDAATAKWGGTWRMPTYNELNELRTKCTWTWTTRNGVKGYNVEGPNGNSIFLPAAGLRYESSLKYDGSYGYYMSSMPNDYYVAYGLGFGFSGDQYVVVVGGNYNRGVGFTVRPITE